MSKIKPLSPSEVIKNAETSIPDAVIQAVNNLLVKEVNGGYATLRQRDIIKEILSLDKTIKRKDIYDNDWLSFENIFRQAGWDVTYDGPGYNESYEPTFEFSKKK